MPLKTHKQSPKHPHHYAKVYWPYLPLVVFVLIGLWVGKPFVERSQRGVLAYSTDITVSDLLTGTNQQRVDNGSQPLTENTQLDQAAQAKANDMATRNYWSHVTPDGKTPWTFIDATGYNYQKAGENLAFGFVTANDIVKGWMNSPPHRENLLDKDFKEVGFGIANSQNYQNSGPETIVVAMYGEPGNKPAYGTTTVNDQSGAAFNTSNSLAKDTNTVISEAQALTAGKTPWITFAIGLLGGSLLAYLLAKHSLRLHRKIRKSEKAIKMHPVLDITILAFVALCALFCLSIGAVR